MSDEQLRQAQRRHEESRTVEDEARWLRERLRAGDLTRERLEIAAHLGDPVARLVAELGPAVDSGADLRRRLTAVPHGLHVVVMRAALAGLRVAGPHAADRLLDMGPRSPTPAELTRAITEWVVGPGRELDAKVPMGGWGRDETGALAVPVMPIGLELVAEAVHCVGRDAVWNAIQRDVADWALGRADRIQEARDRLRQADARWSGGGDVEADARWHRARMDAGYSERSTVLAAAYLGDAASRLALEDAPARLLGAAEGTIRPGWGIGPFRLTDQPEYLACLASLPQEERDECVVRRSANLTFTFDAQGWLFHIRAHDGYEGHLLEHIVIGTTRERVEEVGGPITMDDEDSTLLERHRGVGLVFDGFGPTSRVTSIYVFHPGP